LKLDLCLLRLHHVVTPKELTTKGSQMSQALSKAVEAKASQEARVALIEKLCATRGTKYQFLKSYRSL